MSTAHPHSLLGGVEAGGTKIVCAIGNGPDDVRDRVSFPTVGPTETLDGIAAFFDGHRAKGNAITALGAAWFGPLDLDPASDRCGSLTSTPKPGWSGADVVGGLQERLGVPVTFDTDVNGAALGEFRWGATQGLRSSAYITVGTGIGGGAIVDGARLHGLLHPEMGHLHVTPHPDDTFAGACPFHGNCLEGMASGPAIAARWGRAGQELGDLLPSAVRIQAWYLAQLTTSLLYLLSPQRIVLGGGVMHLDGLLDAVRQATLDRLAGYIDTATMPCGLDGYLVCPGLGDDAGVLGALALAELAASGSTHPRPFGLSS